MSTIKSSDEHLTLNADGSSKDIKFQANGVEKASISSAGVIATNGASLDGAVTINDTGADVDFRVESDTNANALFVQGSDGNVGIGEAAPATAIEVTTAAPYITLHNSTNEDSDGGRESKIIFKGHRANATETTLATIIASHPGTGNDYNGELLLQTNNHTVGADTMTTSLHLTGDGRGLSQFTALAWCDYTGTGINDTFNVSSVSDGGTGQYTFSFSNNMANDTYAVVASTCKGAGSPSASNSAALSVGETRAVGSCLIEVFRGDVVTRRDGPVRMAIFGDV